MSGNLAADIAIPFYARRLTATQVQDRRDEAATQAYVFLRDEFVAAVFAGPQTAIRTPGYLTRVMTIADAIDDQFASKEGEALQHEHVRILAQAAQGQDVQQRAAALVATMAAKHAAWHCGDLVDAAEDDEVTA